MEPETGTAFDRRNRLPPRGDLRWQCRNWSRIVPIARPARRHLRTDKDRIILPMLCNDAPLA
jgi:hypothetical protein